MTPSRHALFAFALVFLLGFLDWLTTVVGLLFCGGVELNPILSGLTQSSMLGFSAAKLAAVTLDGFTAYKAVDIAMHAKTKWHITRIVNAGVLLTGVLLAVIVSNNMMVVFQL